MARVLFASNVEYAKDHNMKNILRSFIKDSQIVLVCLLHKGRATLHFGRITLLGVTSSSFKERPFSGHGGQAREQLRFVSAVDSYLNHCMFPDRNLSVTAGRTIPHTSMLKSNCALSALRSLMDESLHAL